MLIGYARVLKADWRESCDLNAADCEWVGEKQCSEVYHEGRKLWIGRETVFEAVEESGAGAWLEPSRP